MTRAETRVAVVVVGDALLDVDAAGEAGRLSPDAPVPVVEVHSRAVRAGGAGLVATLLARDGHEVTLVTALGDDGAAAELREGLGGVSVVAGRSGAPTPRKTRVRAGGQIVARLDDGCAAPPAPEVTAEMLTAIEAATVVVVADYGRRLTADARLRQVLRRVAQRGMLVWDPHPRGARPVPGAVVTPNLAEARAAGPAGAPGSRDETLEADAAAERLGEAWDAAAVIVTMGARGVLVRPRGAGSLVVPALAVDAADPCGAGDRFAASLAVALGRGCGLAEAAETAVAATSAFLAEGGVGALDRPPNTARLPGSDAFATAQRIRAAGGTVVATGGCFDLLHAGHARTLSAARALGDGLVVCLNSDASVRRLKGPERPIMPQADRVDLLLALECVDAVLVFDENTPDAALRRIRPDIWVKGGDYTAAELPEAAVLEEWGGRTVTVPFHPGRSTTRLASALARVG